MLDYEASDFLFIGFCLSEALKSLFDMFFIKTINWVTEKAAIKIKYIDLLSQVPMFTPK